MPFLPVYRIFSGVAKTFIKSFNHMAESAEILIITRRFPGQQAMQCMVKIVVPLCIDTVTADFRRKQQSGIVEIAFGDQVDLSSDPAPVAMDLSGKLLKEMSRSEIEDLVDRIQPQGVHMKFMDPVEGIGNEKGAHLIAIRAVEVDRVSPRGAVVVGKIKSELAEIVTLRSEVVVNHIEYDGKPH